MIVDVSDIELDLADHLAHAAGDPDDVLDAIVPDLSQCRPEYFEELIERALDRIAEREAAFRRPRSPIAQMVDRACGIVR